MRRDATTLYTWAGQTYVTATNSITFTSIDGYGRWINVGTIAPQTVTFTNGVPARVVQSGDSLQYVDGLTDRRRATLTDEDRERLEAEQVRQQAEREERHRAERERFETTERVARGLLESWLDADQLASYRRGDGIPLVGSAGTHFVICAGHVSNIAIMRSARGGLVDRVCVHPSMHGGLPEPDVHLGQMLALMTDERSYLRIANWDGRRLPYGDDGRLQLDPPAQPGSRSDWRRTEAILR
jgi:hypothetical protein